MVTAGHGKGQMDTEMDTVSPELSRSATDWRSAALVIGELLADVGPPDYYTMNAKQWLVWALKAVERE